MITYCFVKADLFYHRWNILTRRNEYDNYQNNTSLDLHLLKLINGRRRAGNVRERQEHEIELCPRACAFVELVYSPQAIQNVKLIYSNLKRHCGLLLLFVNTASHQSIIWGERESGNGRKKTDRKKESIPDKILLFLHFSFGENHPDHFIVLALPCQGRVLCWKHKNTSANHDHTQWVCDLFKHPMTHFVPPVSKLLTLHQHKPLKLTKKLTDVTLWIILFFSVSFCWYFGSFVCFFLSLCPCLD